MTQKSVATPPQNYLENDDLIFEIGDEDEIETPKKKRADDDHIGYGIETESEEDVEEEVEDPLDGFDEFEWSDEEGDLE